MKYRLKLLPAALVDIEEAQDWYEERRDSLGDEFVVEVELALQRIAKAPKLHAADYCQTRRAQVDRFPYIVYYRIADDAVEIFAVLHSKRDPRIWRSRART